MSNSPITYRRLFELLLTLGFEDETPGDAEQRKPRVFVHPSTDAVLMFRNAESEVVSPADVLSTEVHLHANALASQPLESLVGTQPIL